MTDYLERGVYCTRCKQVMRVKGDANTAHSRFSQAFDEHNAFHKFTPRKEESNIVGLAVGTSLEEMINDYWSSIYQFSIVEALEELDVPE